MARNIEIKISRHEAVVIVTAQMIAIFCPDGKDLADAVINFRFKKEKD